MEAAMNQQDGWENVGMRMERLERDVHVQGTPEESGSASHVLRQQTAEVQSDNTGIEGNNLDGNNGEPIETDSGFAAENRTGGGTNANADVNNARINNGSNLHMNNNDNNGSELNARSLSQMYVLFSVFIALLAIISPPGRIQHHHRNYNHNDENKDKHSIAVLHGDIHSSIRKVLDPDGLSLIGKTGMNMNVEQVAKAAATAAFGDLNANGNGLNENVGGNIKAFTNVFKFKDGEGDRIAPVAAQESGPSFLFGIFRENSKVHVNNRHKEEPENGFAHWFKWMEILPNRREKEKKKVDEQDSQSLSYRILKRFIDPLLLEWATRPPSSNDSWKEDTSRILTELVDKILKSTPRTLTIINLLLAVTYLMHSIVANFFLGEATIRATDSADYEFGVGDNTDPNGMIGMGGGGVGASASDRLHRSGRERLGGYLLFKLLLITAVVEPDTLDLLILLSWYTLLAFLRSLSYLAGITTAHTAASGQTPHRGVLRLLMAVLFCNISAAMTCAALFHGAGIGMVILLTCDCGLLALDILTHLARFTQQILDEGHQVTLLELERRQIELHEEEQRHRNRHTTTGNDGIEYARDDDEHEHVDGNENQEEVRMLSVQLDHEMEVKEATHSNRLSALDNTAFSLELLALMVTIAHFLHVWVLHGVTFNLVDGVLALHLHSAISAFWRKIAERRNHNRIARDLDKCFTDATDMELSKASAAGDVCCICLGTMSLGNVKKVGCGHLYHTHCLREVVERAYSIEAARCPLCRASVLDGKQIPIRDHNDGMAQGLFFGAMANNNQILNNDRNDEGANAGNEQSENNSRTQVGEVGTGAGTGTGNGSAGQELALFRLSTENLLPTWIPIPAFSFEVVRRFPTGVEFDGPDVTEVPAIAQTEADALTALPAAESAQMDVNNDRDNIPDENHEQPQEPSFWRRLLLLAGVVPMSPEEERAAIAQLVDMFPQFDRADMLRELRSRGSRELVVESILSGHFTGVARNGAVEPNNSQVGQPDRMASDIQAPEDTR